MQKVIYRLSKDATIKILALTSFLLSYILNFLPSLAIVFESNAPATDLRYQNVAYLKIPENINSISTCAVAEAVWTSKISEVSFWVFSHLGNAIILLPIFLWVWAYLDYYRPSILKVFLLVTTAIALPLVYLLLFSEKTVSSFCNYAPVIEIKYIYPLIPSTLIWFTNIFLATIILKTINASKNNLGHL
ncbi:MAG: hypothetical protein GY943_25840 [Chloroflexi bacterium]|nr:hypothetical protein [Chloroflexota bacterium]